MRKYIAIARVSLINAVQYRANLLIRYAMYTMFIFVFFSLWRAIYQVSAVEGYTLTQMIWYLCITELVSFGASSDAFGTVTQDVKTGGVAYQLAKPYHYVAYQFASSLGQIAFNFAAFATMALALGMIFAGPIRGFSFATLPLGLLSLVAGILLNFFLTMAVALSAFFVEENSGFRFIYAKLVFMMGTFLPLEFLPGWLARAARFLPFSYVSWAPAKLLVAFSWREFAEIFPVQMVWLALSIVLAGKVYRAGARRLEANGG